MKIQIQRDHVRIYNRFSLRYYVFCAQPSNGTGSSLSITEAISAKIEQVSQMYSRLLAVNYFNGDP